MYATLVLYTHDTRCPYYTMVTLNYTEALPLIKVPSSLIGLLYSFMVRFCSGSICQFFTCYMYYFAISWVKNKNLTKVTVDCTNSLCFCVCVNGLFNWLLVVRTKSSKNSCTVLDNKYCLLNTKKI